jgi:xylulokinase
VSSRLGGSLALPVILMAYYLTYDLGTTALKIALIDDEGKVCALDVQEYTMAAPAPGWAEMAPERYWQAAVAGTRAVLACAQAAPHQVLAIGLSSQGQTFIPIAADGTAVHPAIVWLDGRAQALAEKWTADGLSPEDFRAATGYPFVPGSLTVFQIGWLARHRPEVVQRTWKYLCLPDYLTFRLTGAPVTDYVTARMSGLFDLRTGTWAPAMLARAGISQEHLPVIQAPGTVAGHLHADSATALGLPAGIPVSTGANDQLAGAIGAGNVIPGIVTATVGTALALVATTPAVPDDPRVCAGRHAFSTTGYAMTFANTSAIIMSWLREVCGQGGIPYADFLTGVEAIPPGSDGVIVLPTFSGLGGTQGAILGLTLRHTRAHLARAVMEACACLLQDCLTPLSAGDSVATLRILGGAARSDCWLKLFADFTGLPVERPECPSAASLGAAMLAAVAIGRFPDLPSAVLAWYRTERTFAPDLSARAAYAAVYARAHEFAARLAEPTVGVQR